MELRRLVTEFLLAREPKRVAVGKLYDDSKIFTKKEHYIDIDPIPKVLMLMDPTTRDIPQFFTGDQIKISDRDTINRNLGEILLAAEDVAIAGTTVVRTTAFETNGHRYLVVNIHNPAWTTNPTGLTMGIENSNDAFDTVSRSVRGADAAVIVQNIDYADSTQSTYVVPTLAIVGALGATNMIECVPMPNINASHMARLVFTPAGSAESKNINVEVIGITPR